MFSLSWAGNGRAGRHAKLMPPAVLLAALASLDATAHANPAGLMGGDLPPSPLRPTITKWHGPYTGILTGGQSVAITHGTGTTGVRNHRRLAIAGMLAGHQWRVSRGPAAKYLGIETDIMPLTRLFGRDGNGNARMASLRARYGLTLGETMIYANYRRDFGSAPNFRWQRVQSRPWLAFGCRH